MQFIKNIFKSKKVKNTHQPHASMQQKSYNPYLTLTTGSRDANWSNCDYYTIAKQGYMQNPIMYSCVQMIANGASRVPVILKKNNQILQEHPVLHLLRSPSQGCDGRRFKNTIFNHLLLSGNAYIDCITQESLMPPKALFCLRPDRVACITNKQGMITHYQYRVGQKKTQYDKKRILHLKLFSPTDDYYGCAPTQAAWRAVELHNEATIYQKALLDNAARPSGCLVYSGLPGAPNLTETQFLRLKSELQDHYAGAAAAGRPMVLEGGLDWKNMALSPQDIGISKTRHDAAREIALAYGVPPMMLAIPGDNTYSNYQEALRSFTRNSLIPMAEIFYDALSNKLSELTGDLYSIEVDRKKISDIFIDYLKR